KCIERSHLTLLVFLSIQFNDRANGKGFSWQRQSIEAWELTTCHSNSFPNYTRHFKIWMVDDILSEKRKPIFYLLKQSLEYYSSPSSERNLPSLLTHALCTNAYIRVNM